jgi:hypothetical protein
MKKNQIYQLVSFANAWNKRKKNWESLRSVQKVYVGTEGLKTAYFKFNKELNEVRFYENGYYESKYSEVRVKVEIHIPHIHDDGSLAYYADKVIESYNPSNI